MARFYDTSEEKTGIIKTMRNFDTSEENSVRGSPRRLELVVVRPRFMKREGMRLTKTANAMSRRAAKVDKDYLRREILIHESYFKDRNQYWSFANVLMHAKMI